VSATPDNPYAFWTEAYRGWELGFRDGIYEGEAHGIADRRALAAARVELEKIREREAACCPEDVPFDEYIAMLTKQRDEARRAVWELREMVAARVAHTEACTYVFALKNWTSAHESHHCNCGRCAVLDMCSDIPDPDDVGDSRESLATPTERR